MDESLEESWEYQVYWYKREMEQYQDEKMKNEIEGCEIGRSENSIDGHRDHLYPGNGDRLHSNQEGDVV